MATRKAPGLTERVLSQAGGTKAPDLIQRTHGLSQAKAPVGRESVGEPNVAVTTLYFGQLSQFPSGQLRLRLGRTEIISTHE